MRQHLQRRFKGNQIPGVGRVIADPADQTFQVIDRIQILPYFFPQHGLQIQLCDGIQTGIDFIGIDQGLLHDTSHHTGPHGSFGFIKNPEKRTAFLFLTHGFYQFQIPSAGTVNHHIFICDIRCNTIHMNHSILLCLKKIAEHGTCGDDTDVVVFQSQPLQ